jgi:methionyl-tRNA formyltransferase
MFKPFAQDHDQATFTKMLQKEDKLVNPKNQTALEIYNHYRAYIEFPKTVFYSEYFKQNIRIDNCYILNNNSQILIEDCIYSDDQIFVQKLNKIQKVYLKCFDNSYLEVIEITLANGKKIILKGYQFNA